MAAFCGRLTKPKIYVGVSSGLRVLQRDQKATLRWRVIVEITATPCVDVNGAVASRDELTGVSEMIRENRRTKALREADLCIGFPARCFLALSQQIV